MALCRKTCRYHGFKLAVDSLSLPIVTFGISTTALYYCTLKIVKDEDDGNIRMFLRSFKKNWKEGLIIWLILLPILFILILDHRFFSAVFMNNTLLRFVFKGSYGCLNTLMALCFFICVAIAFPFWKYLAKDHGPRSSYVDSPSAVYPLGCSRWTFYRWFLSIFWFALCLSLFRYFLFWDFHC